MKKTITVRLLGGNRFLKELLSWDGAEILNTAALRKVSELLQSVLGLGHGHEKTRSMDARYQPNWEIGPLTPHVYRHNHDPRIDRRALYRKVELRGNI